MFLDNILQPQYDEGRRTINEAIALSAGAAYGGIAQFVNYTSYPFIRGNLTDVLLAAAFYSLSRNNIARWPAAMIVTTLASLAEFAQKNKPFESIDGNDFIMYAIGTFGLASLEKIIEIVRD